jgi:hypothetical protein
VLAARRKPSTAVRPVFISKLRQLAAGAVGDSPQVAESA